MKGWRNGNGRGHSLPRGSRPTSPATRALRADVQLQLDFDAHRKVKRASKKAKGDPLAEAVGAMAPGLVQLLHDRWPGLNAAAMPDGGYAMARGVVAEVVYSELALARGMRCLIVEAGAEQGMQDACAALRERVRELPLGEVTPDHFGCVHEALAGFHLVAGKVTSNSGRRKDGVHYTPPELAMKVVSRTLEPLLKCIGDQSPLVLRVCDPAVGAGAFPMALMRMLAPLVLERGEASSLDEAKRLVAIHCCYGVDKSRYAVHSCKLAMALEARADRMPRTWLDDNIKHGDALVGLLGHHVSGERHTDSQIATFDWRAHRPEFRPTPAHEATRELLQPLYDRAINEAAQARQARMASLAEMARSA